jgi:hypothetical protein
VESRVIELGRWRAWLIVLLLAMPSWVNAQCCEEPACRAKAEELAREMTDVLSLLGPFPAQPPSMTDVLNGVATTSGPWRRDGLIAAFNRVKHYRELDPDLQDCLLNFINDLDVSNWMVYFNSLQTEVAKLPSPNFKKGWSVFAQVGAVGAADLYRDSERYSAVYGLQFGRTIGRKQEGKERRFRWLIGASMLYQGHKTYFLASPRLEYRLSDIAPAPVNLGCLKLHAQGHFDLTDMWMADAGLAFETYTFGINVLTAGWQSGPADYYFNSGFFVNLAELHEKMKHKRKKKKAATN